MSAWRRALRSSTGAAGRTEPGDWLIALAVAWLAPLALGAAVLIAGYAVVALETALGTVFVAVSGLLFAIAYGLFVSPILGLPALAFSGLACWGLIRLGWGGWLPLLAAGAVVGMAGIWLAFGALDITGPALGALYAAFIRAGLNRLRPDIFTIR